ncbi:hypothetical protein L861_16495 [Litchfieldella anticariensis FP35 = DSM 16096]|uniref:Uncharacterized protein n=1 Tax=Litchfieldella anticariensis (strain DSM 16096 / CECT 5854 / CIP 108499 / LMG 22089 / FP35) TaxID=1121939 RepID=S2KHK4_LITA3|nr:hypothetical protein [Halomonas anticariensis]EPC01617.1 hypothetical protein L861_16495 [Halomonas anticariensis FP35 = DSM 16096]
MIRRTRHLRTVLAAALFLPVAAPAQVIDYDAGVLVIQGVQVFQDAGDPQQYYYLPQFPRLSHNDAGNLELLMMQIVSADEQPDSGLGGIFHALIEFSLPEDLRVAVEAELQEQRPDAELVGALPLLEPNEEEAAALGSFRIVSATLDSDADEVSNRVLTSGPAPLRPGSKAAVATRLTPEEASVLMDTLRGATSDLSVSIRGFYEARVEGYNAIVDASMETIYEHDSSIFNYQQQYTRDQVRDIVDELHQEGALNIEVFDRSEGLGIEADDLEKILELLTDKLIEVMFDTETGWSQVPEPEQAVTQDQIRGRLEQGWFQSIFSNDEDQPYYTDNQYVVKRRENVRVARFHLDLSRSTTLRVPFDSTGNLGGFYEAIDEETRSRHFRIIVPGEDVARQSREVLFQIDGEIAEAFAGSFNGVAVNVRRKGPDGEADFTRTLRFTPDVIESENGLQAVTFFRQGHPDVDWLEYEYQAAWSMRGGDEPLRVPPDETEWIAASDGLVALSPPLEREEIDLDVISDGFEELGIAAVEIELASRRQGEPQYLADVLIRSEALELAPSTLVVWRDPGEAIAWRARWYTRQGTATSSFQWIEGRYLLIAPPDAAWLEEALQ